MALDYNRFAGGLLSSLGSGLMSAGSPGGWSNFAPGFAQGQQQFDQQQYQQQTLADRQKMQALQEQQIQMQLEAQRTANQDKVKQQQAIDNAIGGGLMAPNGMSQAQFGGAPINPGMMSDQFTPQQITAIRALPLEAQQQVITDQMFKGPQATQSPIVKDFYEGGNVVQKQFNPKTNGWDVVGQGPRWAPNPESGNANEMGLAPFYTVDDKGVTHAWQLSKGGGSTEIQLPPGQVVAPQTQFVDTPTGVIPMNKRTAEQIGPTIAKDVAGAAAQTVEGKATAQSKIDLPTIEDNAKVAKDILNKIRTDPSLELVTGLSSKLDPRAYLPEAKGLKALIEQAQGGAFLTAFESLKGGGQITEVEGTKATNAIARMQTAQDKKSFLNALDDYEQVINMGVARARVKAKESGPTSVDTLPAGFQ